MNRGGIFPRCAGCGGRPKKGGLRSRVGSTVTRRAERDEIVERVASSVARLDDVVNGQLRGCSAVPAAVAVSDARLLAHRLPPALVQVRPAGARATSHELGAGRTRGNGSCELGVQAAGGADLVDGGLAGVDPFLELQAGLADLEAQALEVGGLLVDRVRAVAADGAGSDRGLLGVVGGSLDLFASRSRRRSRYSK